MPRLIYFTISCIFLLCPVFCHYDNYYPKKQFSFLEYKTVSNDYSDYILPTTLNPSWYKLVIAPDLEGGTFAGNVVIQFDVLEETDVITLHMNNVSIKLIDLPTVLAVEDNVKVISWAVDVQREFVTFQLSSKLSPQQDASINITYSGLLGNKMLGFYLTTYNTTDKTHLMAITQFESTYARQAFPCFDEPKYRANFSIIIIHPANLTSMSNMQNISYVVEEKTNMVTVTYDTTPRMPTYLVAFGVCDFANLTQGTFQVYARPTVILEGNYVMSVGQNILDTIGTFLDIQYPLKKMDVVAVPDFDAGAMENWGLTTYREKYVLYNPRLNSWKDKFGVLSVVSHEFGHQWFGDLVTPQWWDYAWLNEAFATYFEYTVPDQIEPSWNIGSSLYVMEAVQYALHVDIDKPRPMTSPVYNQSQIEAIFDYVIYEKGGSILRMSENFLTTPVWKKGLNQYLINNQYGTGTPDRLFLALQSAADGVVDVKVNETLQGWTTQPGYPLITVALNTTVSDTEAVYVVTQSPYALDESLSNVTWNVPLTYTTQGEQQWNSSKASKHWLLPSNSSTSMINISGTGWVLFNVEQVGFYRVNYDSQNWAKLKAQLDKNFTAIGSINRAQILDDAFHLACSGHLDYHVVFGLTSYLSTENTLEPWNAFFNNMRFLINQFEGTTTGHGLKQYARTVISHPFQSLTSNATQTLSTFNGALILQSAGSFACEIGLPDCEKLALDIFDIWRLDITNITVLPPDLKQTILCTALRKNVSLDTFLLVWKYYLLSDNAAEQLTLMNAMGCVSNDVAISVYLDAVCNVTANYVRLQDRWIAFRALASNQASLNTTLNYIANNFGNVSNALGSEVSTVIRTIAKTISQQEHITLVKNLAIDPAVDERLRKLLNTIVLPAVAKREAWASSPQATSLKAWVTSYTSASQSTVAINILLILTASVFLTLY